MFRHLTLHVLTRVSYSNLNRDDTGTPKNFIEGGVMRAMHSSQSIKRGIRMIYENTSGDVSLRSGNLAEYVFDRACEIAPDLKETGKKEDDAKKEIRARLSKLVSGKDSRNNSMWLSAEEIEILAQSIAKSQAKDAGFLESGKTGSLAIAAFGRMFANAQDKGTEAAISVSPAVTTHAARIATDYFTAVDDIREFNLYSEAGKESNKGATHIGVAQFTSGVFYRTISIDREQLKKSWTAFGKPESRANLEELISAILYGQPRGKEHSTAPYTQPSVVLAEEQRYRCAYSFETPVSVDKVEGGYLKPSVKELAEQVRAARLFDPDNFGPNLVLTGTYPDLKGVFGIEPGTKADLVDAVVGWILGDTRE